MIVTKNKKLSPLIKYPGGKGKELTEIIPNLPVFSENYYEPFVGGGAVYFSITSDKSYINDKSDELMDLYEMIANRNEVFFSKLERINRDWILMSEIVVNHYKELSNLYTGYKNDLFTFTQLKSNIVDFVNKYHEEFNGMLLPDFSIDIENFISEIIRNIKNKLHRMKRLECKKGSLTKSDLELNFEAAFKSAFYMHFRYLYNHIELFKIEKPYATAIYYFVREYCYSSMYRYNLNGKFNVPYGGISYNKKQMTDKIEYFKSETLQNHLGKTIMDRLDFEAFLKKYQPNYNDFMFIDPPYDTEFSTYAKNQFDKDDQQRLANYLKKECNSYFMLIIKDTIFIRSLYKQGEILNNNRILNVRSFEKKYAVSFKDRNERNVTHLVITNY